MNRVGAAALRDLEDPIDVEIDADRVAALTERVRLVRLEAMQPIAILERVDPDRADSQLRAGSMDTNRNLSTIGDQELLDLSGHFWVSCGSQIEHQGERACMPGRGTRGIAIGPPDLGKTPDAHRRASAPDDRTTRRSRRPIQTTNRPDAAP